MNEQFEKLMYKSGLTAQGCWDEMDSYMHDAIKQFAELIVWECVREFVRKQPVSVNASNRARHVFKHFGVKE